MHEIILKGLSSPHGLSSEQALSNFLRGLRLTARCLWNLANKILLTFHQKPFVQAAYMLR